MLKIEDGWAQEEVADQAKGAQGELGWTFDPAFGGEGYATEAVRALIGLCWAAWLAAAARGLLLRSNRTSLWRRVAPGRWQIFHHQGTTTSRWPGRWEQAA